MVSTDVKSKIISCLENGESFILDAGAGSGKTTTLVEILSYLLEAKGSQLIRNNQKIECITYTNVAKNEIISRISEDKLVRVETIHEFLWDCIQPYQSELKSIFLKTLKQKFDDHEIDEEKYNSSTQFIEENKHPIYYLNVPSLKGGLSHNQVIDFSKILFEHNHKIRRLIGDSFPYIFVDEYQDTKPETLQILLEYLLPSSNVVVGFFGDHMQQIYDNTVGKIPDTYDLHRIQKQENYRSTPQIVDLLNNIRSDLKQSPQREGSGCCKFYYRPCNSEDIENFIETEIRETFSLQNGEQIKKLYLTHRKLAQKNGYGNLLEVYDNYTRDRLVKNKENRQCPYTNYFNDLEELRELYNTGDINQFLKKSTYTLGSFQDRDNLVQIMKIFNDEHDHWTIDETIRFASENNLLSLPDEIPSNYVEATKEDEVISTLLQIKYLECVNSCHTMNEQSAYSTEHGTKGAEYKNVVLVIEDGEWTKYNFGKYFSGDNKNLNLYNRTWKLFYVDCSRARNNLAVVCLSSLGQGAIFKIKTMFGEDNYHH
ncbi:MAG: UvrD-helicase domain-containing protein [Tissierellia bacterium]|nr:UvrD-helicase domain-containing protein [Tissierellia bacterium]